MKKTIVIPTRGDRPEFLEQAHIYANRTGVNDIITVISDKGITANYRKAAEKIGSGLMIAMEDDDWYRADYVDRMIYLWEQTGRPPLFGLARTMYYHIMVDKYVELFHPKRASMMGTMINLDEFNGDWPDDKYAYLDDYLWKQNVNKKALDPGEWLSVGIKHGIGECGGAGHDPNWPRYEKENGREFLKSIIGKDYKFYERMIKKNEG